MTTASRTGSTPPAEPPQALVFDVDGTMYDARKLRMRMAARLLAVHATRPISLARTLRIIRAYRNALEELRDTHSADLDGDQIALAARSCALDRAVVAERARRWMHDEPLRFIARASRPGLAELITDARRRGVGLAAVSDYPAERKLEALGIRASFAAIVSAQDADVQCFKPNPRGLRVALDRLGVRAERAVYVGDRVDVDWPAARDAGMACFIIGAPHRADADADATTAAGWTPLSGFEELRRALLG